ncbi:GrpB family protein [Cronobacter universalis]|uniref:GrpB family protein n=1 Tax=Cronobacter universalis TaxID=535744 RepID=UPI0024AEC64A|nr:GrpB family protein [Cronobacter universalis]MDI7660721.1 GrpB family protein [Cronobacter universalis]
MAARQIALEPYNPAWTAQFVAEEKRVREALGDVALAVHHIGSTSVPGLTAKPVIDMLVEVSSLKALDALNSAMQALGYTPRGEYGIPGRRYFIKGETVRTHHLHAFIAASEQVTRHLAFRDYLRRHDDAAREYAQIKFAAARDSGFQSDLYSQLKDDFIARVEQQALAQR